VEAGGGGVRQYDYLCKTRVSREVLYAFTFGGPT
jgi:hypothetical protein